MSFTLDVVNRYFTLKVILIIFDNVYCFLGLSFSKGVDVLPGALAQGPCSPAPGDSGGRGSSAAEDTAWAGSVRVTLAPPDRTLELRERVLEGPVHLPALRPSRPGPVPQMNE